MKSIKIWYCSRLSQVVLSSPVLSLFSRIFLSNRTRKQRYCPSSAKSGSVLQSRLVLSRLTQARECRPLVFTLKRKLGVLIFYRIDLYLVHVIDDDIVSLVDGDVQVGDALDGVHNQVQVAPAMVLGSPRTQKYQLVEKNLF